MSAAARRGSATRLLRRREVRHATGIQDTVADEAAAGSHPLAFVALAGAGNAGPIRVACVHFRLAFGATFAMCPTMGR